MNILLAVDGSKHSEAAIEMLSKFNLSEQYQIEVITVIDMSFSMTLDIYAGYIPSSTEIEKTVRENAETVLEKSVQQIKKLFPDLSLSINTRILVGSPESRIVETAEELKTDVIIVGSHGYNRWERLLLGSVSNSVVHHAHCSVFIVRNETKNKDKK